MAVRQRDKTMTREEEIKQAAQLCACEYGGENLVTLAFKKGAEWADKFPKSPWISVEERLPVISGGYIVRYIDGTFWADYYDAQLGWDKERLENLKVTHWMLIPQLPK